jgi:hypothetical protein
MRSVKTWRHWGALDFRADLAEARRRVALLPARWSAYVGIEWERRGGAWERVALDWVLGVTASAPGRVPLSATDDDLRALAHEAANECRDVEKLGSWAAGNAGPVSNAFGAAFFQARAKSLGEDRTARGAMGGICRRWGVEPPNTKGCEDLPAVRRMTCARWWLRRLRRAHGRRADGAAIRAGVVRRGIWPYASQDAVERRGEQRRRNARAIEAATVECEATGESLALADVVAGSIANPEVKRSELMVRIKGCDAVAQGDGLACEFWTLTAPSRFHAHKVVKGKKTEPNQVYDGSSPKEAHGYLSRVWARARAAWKRRGLAVFGLRTAEPHHDACPHWHLIAYGPAEDLRLARWLLKRYALQDCGAEPGARKHRFVVLPAKNGRYGAAYAAKYISKNINGEGMGNAGDGEAGRKVSDSVRRVDAWAATWGIRQFQFFGCPSISIWRALRKMRGPVAIAGSMLERARSAADDSDFAEFWRCAVRGGLKLVYRAADCLTAYGDAAAARVAGVLEGARRALLPVKDWLIHWRGKEKKQDGLAFDLPRSCVNNCTRGGFDGELPDIFAIGTGYEVLRA